MGYEEGGNVTMTGGDSVGALEMEDLSMNGGESETVQAVTSS